MPKAAKRTKKFQKHHLKATIKKRKEVAKTKQVYKRRADKKERRLTTKEKRLAEEAKLKQEEAYGEGEELNDVPKSFDAMLQSLEEDDASDDQYADSSDEEAEDEEMGEASDGDDDEDDDVDDEDRVGANVELKESVRAHKDQLEELKKKDPEFFKYLEDNDAELLDFDEEAESEDEAEGKKKKRESHLRVTEDTLDKWVEDVEKKSALKAMKQLVVVFKLGCHASEELEGGAKEVKSKTHYHIDDGAVFNHLMLLGLSRFPALLHSLFEIPIGDDEDEEMDEAKEKGKKKKKKAEQNQITSHSRWKKLKTCVKSYLTAILHFLSQTTEPKMTTYVLKCLSSRTLLVYFAAYPTIAKRLLKLLVHLWGSADETSRIVAFLAMRELALTIPYPFIDLCLKSAYLNFVKNAKFTNRTTLGQIVFMSNCVVELFGLDFKSAYQHAFVYIRLLAMQLRNAITNKTKEHTATVYSWQFVHSLSVWTNVLSTYADQQDLQLLVYPLAQVIQGAIRLQPTLRFYPLRFLCLRMLNKLSAATQVYIPTATFLLEVLHHPDTRKKLNRTGGKPIDWNCTLHVAGQICHSKTYIDGVVEQAVEILLETFVPRSYSIAFPELIVPSIVMLKKFMKNCKEANSRKLVKQLVTQLENNANYVKTMRAKVTFSPRDVEQVDDFLASAREKNAAPLVKYQLKQLKLKEAQAKRDEVPFMDEDVDEESSE